ncbi:CRISPR-associated protein Cas5 [Anaerorudis cellulosivorans]|uniref:CRISPR-associated protein Cas5 n=1 Tax=Anaerorudis cellulosivorans TaxID=3397862 RepID=UPI0022205F09|nr:CRISPR-associated protein Cas5 [Seramator thermalis]MCW1735998.1 CRISPR-associated protein Cas5 [Seramator thermalis]
MKGFQLIIEGNWGHFKKPETNNNPLSHDLITKTALIGLIGAVLGIEREDMKSKYPQLSDDLLYGVQLLHSVRKISWGFTSRKAINPTAEGAPKYFEFLKDPKFLVSIALLNERSNDVFENFKMYIKSETAIYTPVLGWHNCPANLKWESEGDFSELKNGDFETYGFVLSEHTPKDFSGQFRIGFEKMPTFQNDDFWNLPERYKNVIYPDYPYSIIVNGEYYEYKSAEKIEKWCLI